MVIGREPPHPRKIPAGITSCIGKPVGEYHLSQCIPLLKGPGANDIMIGHDPGQVQGSIGDELVSVETGNGMPVIGHQGISKPGIYLL